MQNEVIKHLVDSFRLNGYLNGRQENGNQILQIGEKEYPLTPDEYEQLRVELKELK